MAVSEQYAPFAGPEGNALAEAVAGAQQPALCRQLTAAALEHVSTFRFDRQLERIMDNFQSVATRRPAGRASRSSLC
jgi:hypothetical protein